MATYLNNRGVTLAELLIVVVLLSIVIFGVSGLNYYYQLYKVNDIKRKEDLSKIQKVLEEFHTDHNRYPTVEEMTYEPMADTNLAGKVCGNRLTSQAIRNYTSQLPCEPKSPSQDYVYFPLDNQQKYLLFVNLQNKADSALPKPGCEYGCSYFLDEQDITGSFSRNFYNYYVASSDFLAEPCFGSTRYTACYPEARYTSGKCQACTNKNCKAGYKTLYCTALWCTKQCY